MFGLAPRAYQKKVQRLTAAASKSARCGKPWLLARTMCRCIQRDEFMFHPASHRSRASAATEGSRRGSECLVSKLPSSPPGAIDQGIVQLDPVHVPPMICVHWFATLNTAL